MIPAQELLHGFLTVLRGTFLLVVGVATLVFLLMSAHALAWAWAWACAPLEATQRMLELASPPPTATAQRVPKQAGKQKRQAKAMTTAAAAAAETPVAGGTDSTLTKRVRYYDWDQHELGSPVGAM